MPTPHQLDLRVRVDQYTLVHAIAEMQDGKLYAVQRFVKAAGGCSAPAGTDEADALQGTRSHEAARARRRRAGQAGDGGIADQASELQRHANEPGHPAVHAGAVPGHNPGQLQRRAWCSIWTATFRLSTNPAITFGFVPQDKGQLKVVAHDSKNASFTQSFDVPAQAS